MSFVQINNLCVKYGKFTAVKNLSFDIPKGEVFGFIGPNGAGKTSTIKILATLLKPSSGTVTIGGMDVVKRQRDVRLRIGYMPDFFGVYDDLSANEYLHFFAAAYRLPKAQRDGVIADVLALTDLTAKRDAQVDGLSRGMKQRLSLARVLLHDPDLLLLDEPASGLDPRARIEMRELLKELRRMGKTILISSHILHELSELCTRIGIVETGELVTEGSLDDIYAELGVMRLIHVQVANASDELLQEIRALRGVSHADLNIDRFTIRIKQEDTSVEVLHDDIHKLGARITMYQAEAMDMETVFMKLTEGRTA
ncbi:MAG: ABC transporter ATP-binding protein [Lentisphaerae bacterium]|nr:ABC transporter ATP-binding protein [Lentisphaerota bacterium]